MAVERKKSRKIGLWIPLNILKMPCLSGDEKIYYAYVYSFGERGCWQTDAQIGQALGCGDRTVRRHLANIKKAGLLTVIGEGSKYRKIWAKDHPKLKAAQQIWGKEHGQNWPGGRTNLSADDGQNCPTTIKGTNKSTNKQSGGSPSPAEGQAHAPLTKEEQLKAHGVKEAATASIEQLKKSFGWGPRQRTPGLTPSEREERRQAQLKALLATGPAKTN